MHRSGTSLVARALNLLGMELGPPARMLAAKHDNPKGFWEYQPFVEINDAILSRMGGSWDNPPSLEQGWELAVEMEDLRELAKALVRQDFSAAPVWGWKDPRTCLTLPFWDRVVSPDCYVISLRNPIDVALSLGRSHRISFEKAAWLWVLHTAHALRLTSGKRRHLLFYEDFIHYREREFERLAVSAGLNGALNEAHVKASFSAFLDKELQHSRSSIVTTVEESRLPFVAKSFFLLLRVLVDHYLQRGSPDPELEEAVGAFAGSVLTQKLSEEGFETASQLSRQQETIDSLNIELHKSKEQIETLSDQLNEQREITTELETQTRESQWRIRGLADWVSERDEVIAELAAEHAAKGSQLDRKIFELERTSAELEQMRVELSRIGNRLTTATTELLHIKNSLGWKVLQYYGPIKYRLIKPMLKALRGGPTATASSGPELRPAIVSLPVEENREFAVAEIDSSRSVKPHTSNVDIIICVHNALEDLKRCLDSVIRCTRMPYSLILVDDGSNDETRIYLTDLAASQGAMLLRNEVAEGYTLAANKALRQSSGAYVLLLNSDTEVTPGWLDRMVACAESDPSIGMVGPLSNSATWQSIPTLFEGDDWAINTLPKAMTPADIAGSLDESSHRLYPRIPFLNGFCLMIKRDLIRHIGIFDEKTFPRGYGEENDYCLRARQAGWQLAVADDTYVFHSLSRSYSSDRRKELCKRADVALAQKHGPAIISEGVDVCRHNPVLEGIRARARVVGERCRLIEGGKARWEGKRVLLALPISVAGGGANIALHEAAAMRKMGVDLTVLNLAVMKEGFESSYRDNLIPVIYVDDPRRIPKVLRNYDAALATLYKTVAWFDPPPSTPPGFARGYYIQDFEPYFFEKGSDNYEEAWSSYTRYDDLIRIAKTEWDRDTVNREIGVDSFVGGPTVDIDLYRPRPRREPSWPDRPLRILAMIRPSTPRRSPRLTMEVLKEASQKLSDRVEIVLFGCESNDPAFRELPTDFRWRNAGLLRRSQVARLMNEIDIFVDFSEFQAQGLTAMEAMCCGAAVVAPKRGGAVTFAKNRINSLVVDSSSRAECLLAIESLITDHELRVRLQRQAIHDICDFFPESGAFNTLAALFRTPAQHYSGSQAC